MKRNRAVLLLLLVVVALSQPVMARQDNDSCFGKYAQFTLRAWNRLEACIQETNSQGYFERAGTRLWCNANWISDAWQAEGDYLSCMSGLEKLFGK